MLAIGGSVNYLDGLDGKPDSPPALILPLRSGGIMKRTIATAVAAVFVLGDVAARTPATATTLTSLYVTELYDCSARSANVYLFNTSTARDGWRKVAKEFGAEVVKEGETWLEVKAD